MTVPQEPETPPDAVPTDDVPTADRAAPPPPGSAWVDDHEPESEAEREVTETVRSISRLEESN